MLLACASCSNPHVRSSGSASELFDGRDISAWQHVLADPAVPRDAVWCVRDGMIICKGEPVGALYTAESFTNFRLIVEYRWAPGAKPGNSGIFSRISLPPTALPKCFEVQLQHGNAGDVMGLQGRMLSTNQARFFAVMGHKLAGDIRGVRKTENAEKEPGRWNHVEILAQGGNYTVWMNDRKINEVTGAEVVAGPIGLQSEGGEIQFRRVSITPLPN